MTRFIGKLAISSIFSHARRSEEVGGGTEGYPACGALCPPCGALWRPLKTGWSPYKEELLTSMPGGLRLRCPAGLAGWPGWLAGLTGWLGWLDWLGWMEGMRKFSHARRSEEVGGLKPQRDQLISTGRCIHRVVDFNRLAHSPSC